MSVQLASSDLCVNTNAPGVGGVRDVVSDALVSIHAMERRIAIPLLGGVSARLDTLAIDVIKVGDFVTDVSVNIIGRGLLRLLLPYKSVNHALFFAYISEKWTLDVTIITGCQCHALIG